MTPQEPHSEAVPDAGCSSQVSSATTVTSIDQPSDALTLASQVDSGLAAPPEANRLLWLLVVVIYIGVSFLKPQLPGNTAFVDLPVTLLMGIAFVDMVRHSSVGVDLFRRLAPWWWLVFVASLLALAQDGLVTWGVSSLVRTTFAFLFFICMLHILDRQRLEQAALGATLLCLAITLVLLLTYHQPGPRPWAHFYNPNYAGHYCALAGAIVFFFHRKRWVRVTGLSMGMTGLYLTGSFGGIAMTLTGLFAFLILTKPRGWWIILFFLVIPCTVYVVENVNSADLSEGLNPARFDKSSNTRQVIWEASIRAWEADPLGVGPDGTGPKHISPTNEAVHSDWLGFLTERGPLGLVGLIGVWATIWHFVPRRGITRVLLAGIMVAGLFRETLNYRHLWFLLAIAIVCESRPKPELSDSPDLDTEASL